MSVTEIQKSDKFKATKSPTLKEALARQFVSLLRVYISAYLILLTMKMHLKDQQYIYNDCRNQELKFWGKGLACHA